MAEFELEEGAVQQTEQKLFETGQAVNTAAGRARDSVTGAGGAWLGLANVAATNKQTGEFADIALKLHNEIEHIADALGLGRKATLAEDELNEQGFMNISPEGGYAQL